MAKQELISELATFGITQSGGTETIVPLSGKETVSELEEILERAKAERATPPASKASNHANFSWAHNHSKLARAKAYVNSNQPGLKGKDLEEAVKERYLEINGLLTEHAKRTTK